MFQIKICGVTTNADAAVCAECGADAVGLNFFQKSPRYVMPERAREIAHAVPPGVKRVGLFVDTTTDEIREIADTVGFDMIQLHGNEPPEFVEALAPWPVIKVFRLASSDLAPVRAFLGRCAEIGRLPEAVLLDAHVAGEFGGTGQRADWPLARDYVRQRASPPLILAGGLSSGNVAEAISAVRPAGVDTASGVESSPGRKDPALVRAFVKAARAAFAAASGRQ